jgi:hypothetical protein
MRFIWLKYGVVVSVVGFSQSHQATFTRPRSESKRNQFWGESGPHSINLRALRCKLAHDSYTVIR